jgi:hypothetical protein
VSSEGENKYKVIRVYLVHLAPDLPLILPTRVTLPLHISNNCGFSDTINRVSLISFQRRVLWF